MFGFLWRMYGRIYAVFISEKNLMIWVPRKTLPKGSL